LRILTPVPLPGFKTLHDCEIARFDMPEAATVMISPHLTHRLPELYDHLDRFLSERWLNIRPSTYEYLPFNGGPRRCSGYLFAMANMCMALAVLLSRLNVGLVDGARYNRSYAAVNVPHGAVPALLSLRHGSPVVAKVPWRLGSVLEMFAPAAAA
jgi:cytochrome P450